MIKQRFNQWREALSPATRSLAQYLWRALVNFRRYGTRQAAALSYYAIFSVFPLSLLLAVVISGILGPTVAQEQMAQALRLFLPADTTSLLQENVAKALEQSSSFGLVAIITLVWSGLGLFSNITESLDVIFRVPARRSLWRQRLVALVMIMALIILVTLRFITSGVLQLMTALLFDRPSIWVSIGTFFLPLGLDMVIFALLFYYVPYRKVYWDAIWPAAIFGAIGWELAKVGFEWYLANLANYQFIYGGIATVIVLLFWAYLIASIFLLSAEICAHLNEWLTEQESQTRIYQLEGGPPPQLPSSS